MSNPFFDSETITPKNCLLGIKCIDLDCKNTHPARPEFCPLLENCLDYECILLHPPSRAQKCSKLCNNPDCDRIHPQSWNPEANEKSSCNLRTFSQREEFRKTNNLPILKIKDEFLQILQRDKVVIITAETGSGKTTQLAQYAAEAFEGLVCCTQPRVLATINIARRIADEFDNSSVGKNVGYSISGGDDVKGQRIQILTDAAFIKKTQKDKDLSDVGVLIIDEAHERTLNTDLVLGMAKILRQKRPSSFRVVIASATIDPKNFIEFFKKEDFIPKFLNVEGRVFPIQDEVSQLSENYNSQLLVNEIIRILQQNEEGNTLVFLQGAREIEEAIKIFKSDRQRSDAWISYPLYGSLPPEKQVEVMNFDDQDKKLRMIVFCTNIAETSLTLPNIRIVIDNGIAKEARYDANRRIKIIEEVFISKSSAKQRRGRAGRTAPGVYIQLYSADNLSRENIEPEILRSSLESVILELKMLKIDPLKFPFMSNPNPEALLDSLNLLKSIDCLDISENITTRGRLCSILPFDPKISHFLVKGYESFNRLEDFAILASLITAPVITFFYFLLSNLILFI